MARRRREAEENTEKTGFEAPYISRSERTRATKVVNKVGLQLAGLSPDTLDLLELPQELREAIDDCQKMKTRDKSRQKRLICQLLRAEDHAAIAKRVEAWEISTGRSKHKRP